MTELYTLEELISLTHYPQSLFNSVYKDMQELYGGSLAYTQLKTALDNKMQIMESLDDNPRFDQIPIISKPPKFEESRAEIGHKLSQLDNPFAKIVAQKFLNMTP